MSRDVINVDVDGVLTNGEIWWEETPTVNKEMRKFVQEAYYSMKYVIIIWSARLWKDTSKTVGWLISNDIPFHGVMMQKGATDVYIDDKCIYPTKDELKRLLEEDIDVPACGKFYDYMNKKQRRNINDYDTRYKFCERVGARSSCGPARRNRYGNR